MMSGDMLGRLGAIVQNACYVVHRMGEVDSNHHSMSTTATVVRVVCGLIVVVRWVTDG